MTKVVCDEAGCGWELELEREQIREWHGVPCPKCRKGDIVTDKEMALLDFLIGAEGLYKALFPKETEETGMMRISSLPFRTDWMKQK